MCTSRGYRLRRSFSATGTVPRTVRPDELRKLGRHDPRDLLAPVPVVVQEVFIVIVVERAVGDEPSVEHVVQLDALERGAPYGEVADAAGTAPARAAPRRAGRTRSRRRSAPASA